MNIRKLEIRNFRGIKQLEWFLPKEQKLFVLIGPGDSGKSTILEAIHWLLGAQWNIPVSDTDFFGLNSAEPIRIEAVIGDVPDSLKTDFHFGFALRGLNAEGKVYSEPEDGLEEVLVVRLTIDAQLEPIWEVVHGDGETTRLKQSQRRLFSTFKVDDRTDSQLRWTRSSALGRLSAENGADRKALHRASLAARQALIDNTEQELKNLVKQVQVMVNNIGGGVFQDMKPGLDTSRSSLGATLALYEAEIPLTNFGLGTRRLTSLAIQQFAAAKRAVAVIDELESGLEPHRAVRLLSYFLDDERYSQVFITTHSPIVVEQTQVESLVVVSTEKSNCITRLESLGEDIQGLRRSRPSSFLARKIVVVEGATEYGFLMRCIEHWDKERRMNLETSSAGEGVAILDAQGGSNVVKYMSKLTSLGYNAIGLVDNDVDADRKAVQDGIQKGLQIEHWDEGKCIESQVCKSLSETELAEFIKCAEPIRGDEKTLLADLNRNGLPEECTTIDTRNWQQFGVSLNEAREYVSSAATDKRFKGHNKEGKRAWFKTVDNGKTLADWVITNLESENLSGVRLRLEKIREFIYSSPDMLQTGDETTTYDNFDMRENNE